MSCPNYHAPYCMAHDYDHVLERREAEALPGPFVPSVLRQHFSVHGGKLVAEASDLGMRGYPPTFTTERADGSEITFTYDHPVRDREGELLATVYRAGAIEAHILND